MKHKTHISVAFKILKALQSCMYMNTTLYLRSNLKQLGKMINTTYLFDLFIDV